MTALPPDEPAGRGDEPLAWATDLTVPDDISSLEADIQQFAREQQAARRHARLEHIFLTRRWRAYGISGPMVIAALLLVAVFGAILVVFGPRGTGADTGAPRAEPLATPRSPPGRLGGLLPAVTVRRLPSGALRAGGSNTAAPTSATGGVVASTRDLKRPAALVLVPPRCACSAAVSHALQVTAVHSLNGYVVTDAAADTAAYLRPDATLGAGLIDEKDTLLADYGRGAGGPTLVVVRADGVVAAIQPGLSTTTPLASAFDSALRPRLTGAADATVGR